MTSIGIVDDNPLQLAQLRQLAGRAGFTDIRGLPTPGRRCRPSRPHRLRCW
jgi:hypothetical protein